MPPYSTESVRTAKAFRISPTDTNYFVMLFDQAKDGIDNIFVVEISPGGATRRTSMPRRTSFFTCCMARASPGAARQDADRRATRCCCIPAPSM